MNSTLDIHAQYTCISHMGFHLPSLLPPFFIYFPFAFFNSYRLTLSSEKILRISFFHFNPITRGTSTLSKMLESYARTSSSSHHLLVFFSLYCFHIAVFFTLAFTVSSKQARNSYFSANQCHISLCCHLRILALNSEVDKEQG